MTATTTAELAIYAILSIPNIYILFKHGRAGILGWAYLLIFCSLRVIGGAMDLSGSTSAGLISSVGLSPLLLAASGILHEARTYYSDPVTKKVKWTVLLSFHLIVSTGVAILVTGASNLQSSNVKPSDVSKDTSLVKLGMALLTIAWAMIAIISVWTLARPAQFTTSKSSTAVGTRLLWSVLISNVFTGIRVIYALVSLVTQATSLSSPTGSVTLRVLLSLIPELVSALGFITAGLLTRNAAQDSATAKRAPGRNGRFSAEIERLTPVRS